MKMEKALIDERFKELATDTMQLVLKLRQGEKQAEQQREKINNMEKQRDAMIKAAAESDNTVSIYG